MRPCSTCVSRQDAAVGKQAGTADSPPRTGMPCVTPCSMPPYTSCSGRSSISRSLAMVSNTVTHAASSATRFTSCARGDSTSSARRGTVTRDEPEHVQFLRVAMPEPIAHACNFKTLVVQAQPPCQPQHAYTAHQPESMSGGHVGSQILTAQRTSRRRCDSEICSGTDWPGVSKSATLKAARPRTASMICTRLVEGQSAATPSERWRERSFR